MEQLNRIELRGTVGSIKVQTYSGKKVGRINLATSMAFKDKSGTPVIETQWHSVNAWEGKTIEDVDSIAKATNSMSSDGSNTASSREPTERTITIPRSRL